MHYWRIEGDRGTLETAEKMFSYEPVSELRVF